MKAMNRKDLTIYIIKRYGAEPEYLWAKHPNFAVFRHGGNRKWFAVVMDIPKNKLGLMGTETLDIVNLKCDPRLSGSLRGEPGIFPAYHMNKENWITVALDGSVPDDKLKTLLDISHGATAPKPRKKRDTGAEN